MLLLKEIGSRKPRKFTPDPNISTRSLYNAYGEAGCIMPLEVLL